MLVDTISNDLKEAMLSKDADKTSALRMLISAIRYSGNGREAEISDDEVVKIIQKEIKKRQESAAAFKGGGREELALKEESEALIYKIYLPPQISDEELTKLVEGTINDIGAKSVSDMGKVMGIVLGKVGLGADSGRVAVIVKGKLSL